MKTQRFFACLMPFAVITVIFLTIYAGVQQLNRQSANDTPRQVAEDMASLLTNGADPTQVYAQINAVRKVDVSTSLAPWLAIYSATGTPLATSGVLDGKPIAIAQGVFSSADRMGEDTITLEPAPGVRIAAVVKPFDQSAYGKNPGYVVAGKSLLAAEQRIGRIGLMIFIGWLAAMIGWGIRVALMPRQR